MSNKTDMTPAMFKFICEGHGLKVKRVAPKTIPGTTRRADSSTYPHVAYLETPHRCDVADPWGTRFSNVIAVTPVYDHEGALYKICLHNGKVTNRGASIQIIDLPQLGYVHV